PGLSCFAPRPISLDPSGVSSNNAPMRRVWIAVLTCAAAAAFPASASPGTKPLTVRLARALAVPHVAAARTGAIAFDLTTGTAVFERNPGLSLAPASNEKLAVTYAALEILGPGYRIETDVLGQGELVGTTWRGALVLQRHSDPTLSSADLANLARQVRAAGIRRVVGPVLGDESYFDSRRTGPGWKPGFYIRQSAALSALTVDRTWFHTHHSGAPAAAAAALFKDALRRVGVSVTGRATLGKAKTDAEPLGDVVSPPLSQIVRFMDHESDNFTAELLLKEIGASTGAVGTTAGGAVIGKTGTTSIASALSGFVRQRYVFSVLQNGSPVSYWWARRAQDRFATVLAGST